MISCIIFLWFMLISSTQTQSDSAVEVIGLVFDDSDSEGDYKTLKRGGRLVSRGRDHDSIRQIYATNWTGDLEGAVLFKDNFFKGEYVTIRNYKNQSCINFYRSNISITKFNNDITSVQRSGNRSCFYAYDSIGCIGPSVKFDDEKASRDCAPDLIRCDMNDKISSISFCNTSLSEVYDKPMGMKGTPCRDNCTTRGENYFWCHLEDGKKDYCSPRPGFDPFGNDCGDDCSKEINGKPILYQFANFRGRGFEIDNPGGRKCLSMRYLNDSDANYDNRASSVDIGLSCIILYEHIGCTGKQLRLSIGDNVKCHNVLKYCNFNDITSSVSFCNADFQTKEIKCEHKGYGGSCCVDSCETRGRPYFWCNLQNQDWDYCSPRFGMNFLGLECDGDCNLKVTKFPQSVILYEEVNFKGKEHRISEENEDKTRCINFPRTNYSQAAIHGGFASVDLDSSCVLLYDNIGCVGKSFEVSSETGKSCWEDLRTCNKGVNVVSARLCTARLPSPYIQSNGSGGRSCVTQCHPRGKHYFWCHLGNKSIDVCSPRPGSDYFGNDCGDNCALNETQLQLFDTIVNTQSAILYVQEKFEGRSIKIESGSNTSCFNLDYDEGLSLNLNNVIDSIKLSPGTCLQLYETPFCSGEFKVLSDWDDTNCQERLERCNLKATISSISFCSTVLIPIKSNINRNTGHSPCAGDCSHPEAALHLDHNLLATIYSEKSFQGYSTTIIGRANETKCFNVEYDFERQINFYQAVMSVSIENAACLNLYDGMGCTGNTLRLMLQSETKLCLRDLQTCNWNTRVKSLSFCGSNFPGRYNRSEGFRKGYCYDNTCNTHGSYFWCNLETSWDFCSHRPNLNYMGENWGHESYHSDGNNINILIVKV